MSRVTIKKRIPGVARIEVTPETPLDSQRIQDIKDGITKEERARIRKESP